MVTSAQNRWVVAQQRFTEQASAPVTMSMRVDAWKAVPRTCLARSRWTLGLQLTVTVRAHFTLTLANGLSASRPSGFEVPGASPSRVSHRLDVVRVGQSRHCYVQGFHRRDVTAWRDAGNVRATGFQRAQFRAGALADGDVKQRQLYDTRWLLVFICQLLRRASRLLVSHDGH